MKVPTLIELEKTFAFFKQQSYEGVSGVVRVDSGKPGPVLGITACTHGNEPAGLAMFEYLLKEKDIRNTLQRGTLYLVVNNIAATEKYFAAKTVDGKALARYCDVNMNRLPKDMLQRMSDSRYEVRRAQELYLIWKCFQYGLDVHSTMRRSKPMIISRGGTFHPELVRGFPIRTLISNIDAVQIGLPPFAFYGGIGGQAPVFAIEAGQHTAQTSLSRAAQCSASLLQNLRMMTGNPKAMRIVEYDEYYIDGSVMFPDNSYNFVREFRPFETVKKGELLAKNEAGGMIRVPFNGHLIMPTNRKVKIKDTKEEIAFLALPVKKRRIS